jgi:hypothetical protein
MSKHDPSKSPAEFTAYLQEYLDGEAAIAPLRDQLIILGHFADKASAQMGQGGRPTAEVLVRVWAKMAREGDNDALLILRSLVDHPTLGPVVAQHGMIGAS